jgi:hypothetical protein
MKKILVIGEYYDGMRVSFKIVPPCFQGMDDGKEFLIIDLVVSFSGIKGL